MHFNTVFQYSRCLIHRMDPIYNLYYILTEIKVIKDRYIDEKIKSRIWQIVLCSLYLYFYVGGCECLCMYIQGAHHKFPDFFRMDNFIESTHMKVRSPSK